MYHTLAVPSADAVMAWRPSGVMATRHSVLPWGRTATQQWLARSHTLAVPSRDPVTACRPFCGDRQVVDLARMAVEDVRLLSCRQVPELCGAVRVIRDSPASVGGDGHSPLDRRAGHMLDTIRGQVPYAHPGGRRLVSRHRPGTVPGHFQRDHPVAPRVAAEHPFTAPGSEVPDPCRAVVRPGQQPPPSAVVLIAVIAASCPASREISWPVAVSYTSATSPNRLTTARNR